MLGPLQDKQKQTRRFVAFSAKRKLILMSTYITPPSGGRDIDTLFRTCFFPHFVRESEIVVWFGVRGALVPCYKKWSNKETKKETGGKRWLSAGLLFGTAAAARVLPSV